MARTYEELVQSIKDHESFEPEEYKDSENLPTIAYGWLLPPAEGGQPLPPGYDPPLTEAQGDRLLRLKLDEKKRELSRIDTFNALDPVRQCVVLDCAYNMGTGGIVGFKNFWRALAREDWNAGADELLDSKAATQVTGRMFERAALMRNTSNPQPDLEMLPPHRKSKQRKYAARTRAPGAPPLRLPSETETADAPVTVDSTDGQVIEVPHVGEVSGVQPAAGELVVDDGEDFGTASVAKKAERAYRIARDLGITRTEKEFSELAPEFQIRWALFTERMKSNGTTASV